MDDERNGRARYLSARAMSGVITQNERDELLALIYQSLWSLKDLDKEIKTVHERLCAECEIKRLLQKRNWMGGLVSAISGNRLPWIIIAVLVVIVATLLGIDVRSIVEVVK